MSLPEGVEVVRAKGRTYYYWNPGRGTARQGKRIRLPDAETQSSKFFLDIERLTRRGGPENPDSIAALVSAYRASGDYQRLAAKTRSTYDVHLNRFAHIDGWGNVATRDLSPTVVLAARDAMIETPVMANQMLSVGRTLYDWAIPQDLADINPFDKVKDLEVPDRGHIPWPAWTVDAVLAVAFPDIVRMVKLGIATCQRESDLVRMGPVHRDGRGIWCRAQKTRKRRRSVFIPLTTADALEIDRWPEQELFFQHNRWKTAYKRQRDDVYLFSPLGRPYTPDSLRSRWGRFLRTEDGQRIAERWRSWLAECVERYEWEIDPEDARGPTIHGLRGTGILARLAAGYDVDQIANDIGMSRQMVEHYMRFKDQMQVATAGATRLAIVGGD